MSKLTDTQLVILSTAGQRGDGTALPLPKSLKLQGGAVTHVLKSLLKKELLDEAQRRILNAIERLQAKAPAEGDAMH
jgi:DNA-binding MarR family transcriptional regulator